jgi:hypothetical protein
MQPRRALARARTNEPPASTAERLEAGHQRDAVFALAFRAAPTVRGRPVKANMALFLAKTRLKAHGGDFFASADDRPPQRPRGPGARLKPACLEEARQIESESAFDGWTSARSSASIASHWMILLDFPKLCAKSAMHYEYAAPQRAPVFLFSPSIKRLSIKSGAESPQVCRRLVRLIRAAHGLFLEWRIIAHFDFGRRKGGCRCRVGRGRRSGTRST